MKKSSQSPVFVLGIMPRCGTNFLSNLLVIHSDCVAPDMVWEDYALAHANHLVKFSDEVTSHWDSSWGITPETRDAFDQSLGTGILQFLDAGASNSRTVIKTPSVRNLDLFFRFFPNAKLLLLVRDGRAIIESGMRSFGWRRESALHWLAREAATLNDFVRQYPPDQNDYRVVRYEALFEDTENTMRELLEFLGLSAAQYDFEQASQLPVRGSSEILEQEDQDLHWDPIETIEMPGEFDPLSRHRHWTGFMNFRYQQVAGDHMSDLGYESAHQGKVPVSWRCRSLFLDLVWLLKKPLRPVYHRLIQLRSRK